MKLVDWSSPFKNIFKIDLLTDTYYLISVERKLNSASIYLNVSRNKGEKILFAPHFHTVVPQF